MNIDLHHMRHFVAVAEELHFGRAAARLNMAQPPLSQSIKRLELALGFTLLERSNRRVELTPAGRIFLDEAKQALGQAEAAVRLARQAAVDELAELTVGFVSAALYDILPATLRRCRKRYPAVRIRLDEQPTDTQLDMLQTGQLDIGFLHPPLKDTGPLDVMPVHRDPIVAALPTSNPLACCETIELAALADEDFVFFPYRLGPHLYRDILAACRKAGFAPHIAQEARLMHTILSLVASGMGVSLVPAGAKSMRIDGVAFLPITDAPRELAWELVVAWRKTDRRKALRGFVDIVLTNNPSSNAERS